MVEACAIVVLDGGVVHPGAHVCGKELRQPICESDTMSVMLFLIKVSIEGLEGQERDDQARVKARRDESRDAVDGRDLGWSQ
jgi:hypothetical protein